MNVQVGYKHSNNSGVNWVAGIVLIHLLAPERWTVLLCAYVTLPRDRIKRCTPSVCPSVCLIVYRPSIPCLRSRKAVGTFNSAETRGTVEVNLRSEGHKVKVTGNENVKIVFCSYLCQKWIDLRQTKTKMIASHSTRIVHFSSAELLRFYTICL